MCLSSWHFFGQMRVFSGLRPDLYEKLPWPVCRGSKGLSLAFARVDFNSVQKKAIEVAWEESTDPASSGTPSNSDSDFRETPPYVHIGLPPASGYSSPVLGSSLQTLQSISIPDGIEEIGERLFYKNATLSRVRFGESSSLKRLGCAAFYGSRLEYIHIPNLVEDIGRVCFGKCEHLSHVTFGDTSSLKRIGWGAFFSCSLKQINFPKSLERLDDKCFCGCERLSRVRFEEPSSLKYIGIEAFAKCAMTKIQFPDSVEEISTRCFSGCENLVRATFGASSLLKRIGNEAFSGCSLCEISIPDSVEEMGSKCFYDCIQYSRIKFGEHSSLKSIGGGCFLGCRVVEFSLPKSVVSIGGVSCENTSPDCEYTFRLHNTLMLADRERICYSMGFFECFCPPDSVEYLCDDFHSGPTLDVICLSEGSLLKRIGARAFFMAQVIYTRIPAKVEELGDSCYGFCTRLRTVEFRRPASVQRICRFAFTQCQELKEIEIPETVRTIDEGCFYMCDKLRRVKFSAPSVLEVIDRLAFFGCHLKKLNIPDSVVEIGDECFYMCMFLSSVTFGESPVLKRIGTRAFSGCPLSSISIPDSVEEIGDECFYNCKDLSSVSFGNSSSLTSVGANAFGQLSTVTCPDGVTIKAPARQIVRVAVIGQSRSGKASLIAAYTGHKLTEDLQPPKAHGADYFVSSVQETFNEETYELQITAINVPIGGKCCFMTHQAFDVFIFVATADAYDFCNDRCRDRFERFISRFPDGQRLLVGSMMDRVNQRKRHCMEQKLDIPYIACSAKTGENIREVFRKALELYLKVSPEPSSRREVS